MRARLLIGIAMAVGVAGQGASAAAPDQVTVASGALKGVIAGDVVSFKGIPYAAPPVGDLRWRPPAPPASWHGVRPAASFGHACWQTEPSFASTADQSEDCLTLNVWTPARHDGAKLPVMVWIHGGGFIGGTSAYRVYDGASFAEDGVVLVSLNYRLGRLGWYAHPALLKEPGPVANYGLMDELAALKWVRANIAAFGGDPGNVTIFGESAGGIMVNFSLISPEAHGLFDKAISESGFGRFDPPPVAQMAKTDQAYAATRGVTGDGPAAAASLRALPAQAMLEPVKGLDASDAPRPMKDGVLISERVDDGFARGHQARLPYLLGGNSFEASLYAAGIASNPGYVIAMAGPDHARTVAFFGDGSQDSVRAAYNMTTEGLVIEPDRKLAQLDTKTGVPVYLYYFSYLPPAQRTTLPGAEHGAELGYVFESLPPNQIKLGTHVIAAATPPDLAISAAMHAYWVAFAKTGDPGTAGGPRWPAYSIPSDPVLEFGVGGVSVRQGLLGRQLDAIAAHEAAQRH